MADKICKNCGQPYSDCECPIKFGDIEKLQARDEKKRKKDTFDPYNNH